MTTKHTLLALALAAALPAAAQTPAQATLMDAQGRAQGRALFTTAAQGVQIEVQAQGLAPGFHGFHIHRNGDCGPGPDGAEGRIVPMGAAGPHFDPMVTRNHGKPDAGAHAVHAGDLPNLKVEADGNGTGRHVAKDLSLAPGKTSVVGRTIVVHEKPDDHESEPSGNSGPRLLCGVIEPQTPDAAAFTARWTVPGSNAYPEGIAVDEANGIAYTGSATEGHLYRIDLRKPNSAAEKLALGGSPGRQAAIGIKLDARGRLWVAGGPSGRLAIVDAKTGDTQAVLKTPPTAQSFINDLVLAGDGHAYITDSTRPVLWRTRHGGAAPGGELEPWLDLERTPIRYGNGVNLNGIVATPDGRSLVTVQSLTGQLWHIDTRSKAVREIRLDGAPLANGDGLVLDGRTLWVVRNAESELVRVDLDAGLASGRIVKRFSDPRLKKPTTAARLADGSLLVMNGQLEKQKDPPPLLPFDVVKVKP